MPPESKGIHMLFLVAEGETNSAIPLAQRALDMAQAGLPVSIAMYVPESPLPLLQVPESSGTPNPPPFMFLARIQRAVNVRETPGGVLVGLMPVRAVVAVFEEKIVAPTRIYWRIGDKAWVSHKFDTVTYAVKDWQP